ncbi:hypothetical protein MMC18_002246, partial [Xylographa bjoerkii]|nr:hypothetical protein [Xylographa bjoerkii]
MCFPSLKGDLPDDPTNQPVRVMSSSSATEEKKVSSPRSSPPNSAMPTKPPRQEKP